MEALRNEPLQALPKPDFAEMSAEWIKIGCINVRGYINHLSDIKKDNYLKILDVVCFTETHLQSDQILSQAALAIKTHCFQCNRSQAKLPGNITAGGGVMIQ